MSTLSATASELSPMPPPVLPAGGRIPGNKGIWVGIFCEMTEFALLFIVYFLARAHYPEAFRVGPGVLATWAGTANTIAMLTSSWCVMRAVCAIRRRADRACLRWLAGALLAAASYLVIKYFEFGSYTEQGIGVSTSIFHTVFYYLTFNHLVHVVWGSLGIFWVMGRTLMGAYSPEDYEGLEAFASYWHTIDLAWLVIFPLLYVWR